MRQDKKRQKRHHSAFPSDATRDRRCGPCKRRDREHESIRWPGGRRQSALVTRTELAPGLVLPDDRRLHRGLSLVYQHAVDAPANLVCVPDACERALGDDCRGRLDDVAAP